ncbi:MAG: sodium:glutamate symporter [Eubacteriaceae bacterium]|nr:sodium:glutamate symporter [Eubacteriaceae bacterium]
MDYSAANTAVWNPVIQCGILAATILLANLLRRKVGFIRRMMMPTAVLGGFILLILKITGLIRVDPIFMEGITYHCIAIGFIATSLRIPSRNEEDRGNLVGLRSGAIIVGSYMIQAVVGLAISILLGYTLIPSLFKASGILLPMGYGQGPGQANNIGGSYEALGFAGGRSFGLALAAAGYVCACIVGVIYLNYLVKKGKLVRRDPDEMAGSVTIDTFQDHNEIPISESVDRFSVQMALVLFVYLATFLLTKYLTMGLSAISEGLGNSLNSLLWGFNFMIGSGLAIGLRSIFSLLRKSRIMVRQYQNNYLLSRISGFAFDLMIVAGIVSIELEDLSGLWIPFILMAVSGAVVTLLHLKYVCSKVYPGYYYEGLISMYGMMTGTISSGVLLLREIDPNFETPAANNLVIGSSFAILLGAPLLVLVSLAPKSDLMTLVTLGLIIVYYAVLLCIVNLRSAGKKKNS